eukprot:6476610-Amphidinium_carterae.1
MQCGMGSAVSVSSLSSPMMLVSAISTNDFVRSQSVLAVTRVSQKLNQRSVVRLSSIEMPNKLVFVFTSHSFHCFQRKKLGAGGISLCLDCQCSNHVLYLYNGPLDERHREQ